ncbi:hypothetical protein [Streptomyces lunalinharesii]|uniref:MgtC-like C-terminal domain-containing protein n=1 Tax=Streptomyces lunalinharesii TaxID=333384 RepID=A0ABN3T5S4_9ACTN
MRFLFRSSIRQNNRPGTETPVARSRELVTLHVHCDRGAENKVRALCVLAMGRPGARVEAVRVDPSDAFTAHLRLTVTLDGTATSLLDRLLDMLSGMPSVRDLHWHRHDVPGNLAVTTDRGCPGTCAR